MCDCVGARAPACEYVCVRMCESITECVPVSVNACVRACVRFCIYKQQMHSMWIVNDSHIEETSIYLNKLTFSSAWTAKVTS